MSSRVTAQTGEIGDHSVTGDQFWADLSQNWRTDATGLDDLEKRCRR